MRCGAESVGITERKPFPGMKKGLSDCSENPAGGEYEILYRMREKPYFPPVFETAR